MKYNFSEQERAKIKKLIAGYRNYDKERFGTNKTSITYEEWLELAVEQDLKCWWTGKELTIGTGKPTDASLDRVHSSEPHTKSNSVLCHKQINLMKNAMLPVEFAEYLDSLGILSEQARAEFISE